MATKIRFKRGATSAREAITPDAGEPVWDTDEEALYVGDGSTAGGIAVGGGTPTVLDYGSIADPPTESNDWGSVP